MSPEKPPHLSALGDPRGPLARLLAAALLIVGVAVGLILYAGPEAGQGAAPPLSAGGGSASAAELDPTSTSLWVNASRGAAVYLDGDSVGVVPLWVDSVTRGLRRVRIVDRRGVTLADTTLSVLAGSVTDLDLTGGVLPTYAEREDFAAGGGALADRPPAELTTPVTQRPEAPAPPPAGSAQTPRPASQGSTDEPARTSRPTTRVARPSATGALRITSSPAGAGVRLGGRTVGVTPLVISDLRPGRYDVVVGRLGYETVTQAIQVRGGAVFETNVALRVTDTPPRSEPPRARPDPLPVPRSSLDATGAVEVWVKPWGRIVIDGETHQRETDVIYRAVLAAGEHEITVSHPQLGSATRTVVIPADGQVRVEIDLSRDGL